MKNIIILSLFFFTHNIYAQTCEKLKNETFTLKFGNGKGTVDRDFSSTSQIKFPAKGIELNQNTKIINCASVIPNGSNIISIKIIDIIGLPKGLTWSTNKPNNNFVGGESGCIFVSGKPEQKGTFKLSVKSSGIGKYTFFSQKVPCDIDIDNMSLVIN